MICFVMPAGKARLQNQVGFQKLLVSITGWIMLGIYGIALLTCFIVNMAVNGGLTWFYIVLSSIALAFSITNIPVMVRTHKIIKSGICATVMVYVLLWTCNWFVGGNWLYNIALPIASLSLVYVWVILLSVTSRMYWVFKVAIVFLIAGIAGITINPWVNYLLGSSFFNTSLIALSNIGNVIASIFCIGIAIIIFKLGINKRRTVNAEIRKEPSRNAY